MAIVAALFGLVTIFVGVRVLSGVDPGYIVFQPLLIYNTSMGLAYLAAGLIIWRNSARGMTAAGLIFCINLLVLLTIVYLFLVGRAIAVDSLRAMSLRTIVWLVLYIGLSWIYRRKLQSEL